MILVRFIVPYFYSLLLGLAWSVWFNKKFSSSLAPAYMLNILLTLICGMMFNHLSFGIIGGIGLAVILLVIYAIKAEKNRLREILVSAWKDGILVFTIFYIFSFFVNHDKHFTTWDEFSHWGMFLKESMRLDALYCTSPIPFVHKDYVPAITIFETIWGKLNFRYSESDAYRAVQILMFSLMMPMFESISSYVNVEISTRKNKHQLLTRVRMYILLMSSMVLALIMPLFLSGSPHFYHSIYCDVVISVMLFWCIYVSLSQGQEYYYDVMILSIGLSVLVLSKMLSMAFLPLIVALQVIRVIICSEKKPDKKQWLFSSIMIIMPVAFWAWYNSFMGRFVDTTGNIQSYEGMNISMLFDVFGRAENSTIPYLKEVRRVFGQALIHMNILQRGSYAIVLPVLVLMLFVLAILTKDAREKKKRIVDVLWVSAVGIFYALLMYFLYATAFSEEEAVCVASFERYMNTYIFAIILFLVAAYFDSGLWKKKIEGMAVLSTALIVFLLITNIGAFNQVLPGSITHDDEKNKWYTASALKIENATAEDANVYIIQRGQKNRDFINHLSYYCNPRLIGGGNIGPEDLNSNAWAINLSENDLRDSLIDFDYIWFCKIDEAFVDKYSGLFEDPSMVVEDGIYRIACSDGKIQLIED